MTPQSTHKQASGLLDDSSRSTDIVAQSMSDNSYPEGTIISFKKIQKNDENEYVQNLHRLSSRGLFGNR